MRHIEDTDVMARLRSADPVDLGELERTVAPLRARVKQRAIERGNVPREPIPAGDRIALEAGGPRRGRRWPAFGFASLACAAVLAAVALFSGGSLDSVGGSYPGFAAAAVKVAEANPRLLVTAPGWKIVEARSFQETSGQLYLADGKKRIHLFWLPASYYEEFIRKGAHPRDGRQVGTATIAGRKVTTIYERHTRLGSYSQAIFRPEGGVFVELEGSFGQSDWKRLMASVRAVGVEEWLRAMPGEIIRPGVLAAETKEMLREVPLPPDFDATATAHPSQLTNRFQAAKRLTEAVACRWVERWKAARGSGESTVADEAVEAMASAPRWPVLLQMVREKGYRGDTLPAPGYQWPTSIITIANQMATGHLKTEPTMAARDGKIVTTNGFRMPKGAYPPATLTCFPPPASP